MTSDELYILRCIELAKKGISNVAPNPMVGAVIVYNGNIIGEGYHQQYGQAHAEVNAINAVEDKSLLSESTIYVSLEPCAHTGKTPPCADLIIKHRLKKVVIGCSDSYKEVNGLGVQKLLEAGIEVEFSSLEHACRELNKRFFTFHEKKRPFVTLKWAETKNGMIDEVRTSDEKKINWISSPQTKVFTHTLRTTEQAILVGKNTVINDNPTLTVRNVAGKNPIRIVLDSKLELGKEYNIFNSESKTIVLNTLKDFEEDNIQGIKLASFSIQEILSALYRLNINSVLIEGGKQVLQHFIEENLWDEAFQIIGNKTFENGLPAPTLLNKEFDLFNYSEDIIKHYRNTETL